MDLTLRTTRFPHTLAMKDLDATVERLRAAGADPAGTMVRIDEVR
ncbi:hypothetical protein [Cellulomonas sp. PhB143]|nr:hypothetical protein [Cellulomonas sp. PhB143]